MERDRDALFDDDNPEWTEADFARAIPVNGDLAAAVAKLRRARGRPPAAKPKPRVTMRLDQDVLDHYKATGRGWQTRINEVLRKAGGL